MQATTSPEEPSLPGRSATWIGNYRLLEKVGEGGMGVVYRAFDHRLQRTVALKELRRVNPDDLARFKNEARHPVHLSHPNLVTPYELFCDSGRWCFTMPYVEGEDFLRYVTGRSGEDPAERAPRLFDAFHQLAQALVALHTAGIIHRDVKPSNALVTTDGQVKLLDFGLAARLDEGGVYRTTADHLVGTIAYMSPEHIGGSEMTSATDWYSTGAMLYEALTGRPPFSGSVADIILAKLDEEAALPPAPPGFTEGIHDFCLRLLRRAPGERPSDLTILNTFARYASRASPAPAAEARKPDGHFVGRDSELSLLHDAFARVRLGSPAIVYVRGESGAGKTTLVRRFLDQIGGDPEVVVLSGRCYEQESVPFKALDNLVDAVAHYLRRLPPVEVQALLPRDVRALARVFPVLRRVEAIDEAPSVPQEVADAQELRRRASTALRELLARLGDRHPLVIAIDDLHWGDVDSAMLLTDLLVPPDPPVFLGLGCYRTEEAASSPFLRHIQQSRALSPSRFEQELVVDRLDPEATRDLALALLAPHASHTSAVADAIVRESAGRPFLVYELVEHVKALTDGSDPDTSLSLDEALWRRIQRLPQETRTLLEVIAVAGRPIDRLDAFRSAQFAEDDEVVLQALRADRLIRLTNGSRSIEAYHDRVRQCLLAHLSMSQRRDHHRSLAGAFAEAPHPDAEALAFHYDGAGEADRAATCYAEAARVAAAALAFDHAAVLYRRALTLKRWSDQERRELSTRHGDALAAAGRGYDAAKAYLAAADQATPSLNLELHRRAALQLLTSGHVDEGLARLAPVLRAVGTRLAGAPWRALLSLLLHRGQLRLRGLDFVERPEHQLSSRELQRIDIGWSVVIGLSIIDPIRGMDFQTRSLLLALEAGEPFRVARALAVEAAHQASSGSTRRATIILDRAQQLADRLSNPYATGMVQLARGTIAYFAERWPESLAHTREAEATFRQHCTGVTWEIDTANAFSLWSLVKMGRVAELNRVTPALLKEAHERGDLYAAANLSTQIMALVRMAADDPEGAKTDLQRGMREWSQNGYHVQHHDALQALFPLELYCNQPRAAWELVADAWSSFRWSLLSHVQDLRVEMLQMRAYAALAMAAESRAPHPFLKSASRDAARLQREKLPWAAAFARYIEGTVAALTGDSHTATVQLAGAVRGFDALSAGLYAAVVRRRLARLAPDFQREPLQVAADEWFASERIANPGRMTAAYAPGFPE